MLSTEPAWVKRLEKKIDSSLQAKRWKDVVWFMMLIGLAAWNIWCQSERATVLNQLRHDNQILYFLVAIATAENNADKAKIHRDMNAYKRANGLR